MPLSPVARRRFRLPISHLRIVIWVGNGCLRSGASEKGDAVLGGEKHIRKSIYNN